MFRIVSGEVLLPEFGDSYGVVFRDLNNDSLADLYVVRFRDLNRLFVNRGKAHLFMDYTIQSGLGGNLMSRGASNLELGATAADVNNDGKQDILIVGWGTTTHLFFQEKDLYFREGYSLAEDFGPIDGNAGVWADVNRDGYLDLFITDEHHQNHLLINNGAKGFEPRTREMGLYETAAQANITLPDTSQGAAFADLDGDQYPDLYVCNWFARDVLYRNLGGEKFVRMGLPIIHLQESLNSNGVSFGDIDNDGDLDMLVTDRHGVNRLYRNDTASGSRQWEFQDVTEALGIENPCPAYGSVIADFNNDGFQDIFFTNIGPNQLFLNSDSGYFSLVYEEQISPGSTLKHYSTGAAVADYDRDGDLDLFVANKDTISVLYQNPHHANTRSIRICLEGVISNRDAIGAKLWLYGKSPAEETERLVGYREISGGSGYLSFNEPVAHFGVAPESFYRLKVWFPSGSEIQQELLTPGRTYWIAETGGVRRTFIRAFQYLRRLVESRFFWLNSFLFILVLLLVIGFSFFSIRRYHWQNKQTALFLISILVLLYALLWLLNNTNTTTILLSQVLALTILLPIIAGFMEKIRRLEAQRYGYRQLLQHFSQQLIFIKDNTELYEKIVNTIQESMGVAFCSAMEVHNMLVEFKSAAGRWDDSKLRLELSEKLIQQLSEQPVLRVHPVNSFFATLAEHRTRLIIPLTRKDKLYALLLLGPRNDQKEFRGEDLGVLQILANQAAIAIENNLYIEESKKLIQKLTESELREKYVQELESKNETLQNLYRELQQTQTQLIQSEKMASLGQLVAGIAHELNNPISFVYANMKELQQYAGAINELLNLLTSGQNKPNFQEILQHKLRELDQKYDLQFIRKDIDHLIDESIEGSQRVKDVVKNLRNFSRLDEAELKEADLHEGLDSTLLLLNNEFKNRIQVHKHYRKLPKVYCNPGYLNQVFMNLLLNASQAIPETGDIWISTKALEDKIEIEIRDNGKGIAPPVQDKIFDPFFTTKGVGKGTGLGLSISYNIIQKHGGEIRFRSAEGRGTTFTIVLPINRT